MRHNDEIKFSSTFYSYGNTILLCVLLKVVPEGSTDDKPTLVWVISMSQTHDKSIFLTMLTKFTDSYMRHQALPVARSTKI